LNGKDLGEGCSLYVGIAQSKAIRRQQLSDEFSRAKNETNIFVRSLKRETTEEQIRAVFGKYGEISSLSLKEATNIPKILLDQNIIMKFAFVNYKTAEGAKKAFSEAKKDQDVKDLIHEAHDLRKEYVFFTQNKAMREQYLKMQKKNFESANFLQRQYQMMMIMMEQTQKLSNIC
jgi:hypothetical protein